MRQEVHAEQGTNHAVKQEEADVRERSLPLSGEPGLCTLAPEKFMYDSAHTYIIRYSKFNCAHEGLGRTTRQVC